MTVVFICAALYFAAYSAVLFFMTVPIWVGLNAIFVFTAVAVAYTTGAAERAHTVARHLVLFLQAVFLSVFISIGSTDRNKFFAVLIGTIGCFIVSIAMEMWISVYRHEE